MVDVSKFKPKTVYVTYIAATPEKVWQALTDPEFSKQYFFGFAVTVEPCTGGAVRILYPDGRVHGSGEVIEWSPRVKLSACAGAATIIAPTAATATTPVAANFLSM